jgi:hypothetical protein
MNDKITHGALKVIKNAYFYAVLFTIIAVWLFVGVGFHEWHNSHLTPHMLGVSLNLKESNLLCNSITNGCESYHRHPPIYFYINYILANISLSPDGYFYKAMTFSIVMNYIGVVLLMAAICENNRERILFLAIFSTSTLFLANLTLSNYESLYLIIFGLFSLSIKKNNQNYGYVAVLLGTMLSWFTILASIVFVIMQCRIRKFYVLIPFFIGGVVTVGYLILGYEYFWDNFQGATKNINFSGNISNERSYGLLETIRMLIGTVKHLAFPSLVLVLLGFVIHNRKLEVKNGSISKHAFLPIVVVGIWNIVFFRWSVIHNFVYIVLLISFCCFAIILFRNYSSKLQKLVLISLMIITTYQHSIIAKGYNKLSFYDNVGVSILKEALVNYGDFNH